VNEHQSFLDIELWLFAEILPPCSLWQVAYWAFCMCLCTCLGHYFL